MVHDEVVFMYFIHYFVIALGNLVFNQNIFTVQKNYLLNILLTFYYVMIRWLTY